MSDTRKQNVQNVVLALSQKTQRLVRDNFENMDYKT